MKFYSTHVLRKPWVTPGLIKPPKAQRLPDIVTVEEAQRVFAATRTLSYRVFFFTLYSLGLRLGEGLPLQVGDIDAARQRVHVRDAKATGIASSPCRGPPSSACAASGKCIAIRCCCSPIGTAGCTARASATTPLDRGGVQTTLRQ